MRATILATDHPDKIDPQYKMWEALRAINGCDITGFKNGFERINIFEDLALNLSLILPPPHDEATIVVLGKPVARALGLRPDLFVAPQVRGGVTYRVVPHPVQSDWFDDPNHRFVVGLLLEELICT